MVLVIAERRARRHEAEIPLDLYRVAVDRLPQRGDSLLDRLFALECLTRAGRHGRAAVAQLASAQRAAASCVEHEWDADVPHAAILGQALAAVEAAGEDPPREWPLLLDQALAGITRRQTRFGFSSDPVLLAAIVRGLAATELALPSEVVDAGRSYLAGTPTAVGAAELAEAFARHRAGAEIAEFAAKATFSMRADATAAIARWWLAERFAERGVAPPADDAAVRAAHLETLSAPEPDDARVAAMLAEVTARSVANLVVMPAEELAHLNAGIRTRVFAELYLWRVIAAVVACAATLAFLHTTVTHIYTWLGAKKPPTESVMRALAGIVVYVGATLIVLAIDGLYRRTGRTVPHVVSRLEWIIGGVAAAVAAALYG